MQPRTEDHESPHLTALKAAVTYLAIAVLWLVFTEQILQAFVDDAVRLSRAQLLKSLAFMAMTSGLLYWVARRSLAAERAAQRSLRESQARSAALFNGSSDPVFVFPLTPDSRFDPLSEVNDLACRQLGLDRDTLRTMRLTELASPAITEPLRALQPGIELMLEGHLLPADGPPLPVEVHARRLSLGEQSVVIATARDLSSRQAAEQAIQDSERRYRLLAENAHDLIWTLDVDGTLSYLSPSAERLLGTSRAAIRADPSAFAQPALRAAIRRILQGDSEREQHEICIAPPARPPLWLEVELTSLRDPSGSGEGILGISRDITARRAAEAQQRLSLQQLHQAQKMEAVGTLAGGVAHDLNNLLAVIIGNAELAALAPDAPQKRLDRIQMAAGRASALVQKLLLFARQQPSEPQPTDINAVIRGVLDMLGQLLGARIAVEVDLSPQLRMVSADPTQLDQVLLNLAVNARDAMPEGGTLRFETDVLDLTGQETLSDGQYVRIRVSDTGTGMPPEVRARVFEPFFTTKELGKGTGLGLSTAYGILQEHGGDIRLRSAPGRGTTFSLLLPATDAMAPAPAPALTELPAPPPAAAVGHAILVVEDEVLVQGMISEGLSRLGHTVVTATTLADARARMRAHPPFDLMICDVILPDGLGYTLLSPPGAPALMISGHSQEQLASHSTAHQPTAPHLHKPFSLKQLSEAVGSLLGAGRQERAERAEP